MKFITITREADNAIRSCAIKPIKDGSTTNPDGTVNIPLSEEVIAHLSHLSSEWGLTLSDTIIRALTQQRPQ